MLHGKLMALALVGLGVVAAAAPTAGQHLLHRGELADSPLGKLLTGHLGRLLVLKSEMNLTDEQRSQIREVVRGEKADIAKVAEKVWQKRNVLRDAVLADKPDEAAIRAAADDLGKAIGDAAVLGAKVVDKVKPVLTAEQRAQVKKCHKECEAATAKFFAEATAAK